MKKAQELTETLLKDLYKHNDTAIDDLGTILDQLTDEENRPVQQVISAKMILDLKEVFAKIYEQNDMIEIAEMEIRSEIDAA